MTQQNPSSPLVLVTCPVPIFAASVVSGWKKAHPGYYLHTDTSFADTVTPGDNLFGVVENHILMVDSIIKKDFDVMYRCEGENVNILIVCRDKPRFSLKGFPDCDHVDIPVSSRDVVSFASDMGVSTEGMNVVRRFSDDPVSGVVVSWQVGLVDDFPRELGKYITNPCTPPDTAPWGLFNAILDGSPAAALEELDVLLFNNNNDPMAIIFPMIGYMRKVIMGKASYNGDIMTKKQYAVFSRAGEKVLFPHEFMDDLSHLTRVMFMVNKKASIHLLRGIVVKMSTRCGRGATGRVYKHG